MESPLKPDSSDVEMIDKLVEESMAGDQDQLYLTIISMLTSGLDLGINNVRILYQHFPEGPSKDLIKRAIVETLATFLHSTYRTLYDKESLRNQSDEAVYDFSVEILSLIKEKYDGQASVLQQDSPASSDADEKGGERKD